MKSGMRLLMVIASILPAGQTISEEAVPGPALDRACGLLNDAPKRVKASAKNLTFRWHNEILDRSVADKVRVEILEALVALTNAK